MWVCVVVKGIFFKQFGSGELLKVAEQSLRMLNDFSSFTISCADASQRVRIFEKNKHGAYTMKDFILFSENQKVFFPC